MPTRYVPVLPREHDAACRRDSRHPQHFGIDRENCERCRNLWKRLEEAEERRARNADA